MESIQVPTNNVSHSHVVNLRAQNFGGGILRKNIVCIVSWKQEGIHKKEIIRHTFVPNHYYNVTMTTTTNLGLVLLVFAMWRMCGGNEGIVHVL